jgi:hypothetical protein
VIRELHSGGLARHFGQDKTVALVDDLFFWLGLRKQVAMQAYTVLSLYLPFRG